MHKYQKKILEIARKEDISAYGLRKLGEKIGVDHPQKVKWHLHKLINDGYLYKNSNGEVRLAEDETSARLARVPIMGLANCGEALSFTDNVSHEYLTVSPGLLGSKNYQSLYAVQATGNSMNACSIGGLAIDDGDYVVVDGSVNTPNNGDYVVSSIEGLANIKKFVKDSQNRVIALISESSKRRPPIVISDKDIDSYRVNGKVVAVIKSYA